MSELDLTRAVWRKSGCRGPNGDTRVTIAAAVWPTSTRRGSNGDNCVEITAGVWRMSTRSVSNGSECVEFTALPHGVAVRDSRPTPGRTVRGWRTFVNGVRDGTYDL